MIRSAGRRLLGGTGLEWLLLLGLSAPTLSAPWSLAAQPRQATVLSVGDGDTIRVRQGGRAITVRLACIDALEMTQSPHGKRAREVLRMRQPAGWEAAGRHWRLALMSGLPTLAW